MDTDHQKPVDDASALLEDDGLWGEFEHQVDDKGRTITGPTLLALLWIRSLAWPFRAIYGNGRR